jgi:ubiquinone/menaquinone biosynthesis C-methylase UbiE
MTDLSYREKQDRLKARIRAHKLFANFDIDEWIDQFLGLRPRRRILDLACGNGNHLSLYLKHVGPDGTVAGIDREPSLIAEARASYPDAPNLDLRVGTMDERLPFADASFDLCFSNFAIYNAADSAFTLRELKRVMEPGAELVLIGPTMNNAREIYEFNERLTGQAIDPITLVRTDRLRQEILPVVREVFGGAREEVINSRLTFPDQDEFIRYYTSTMLYEEGAEKLGYTEEQMRAACSSERDIVLSKEMLAVLASRDENEPRSAP